MNWMKELSLLVREKRGDRGIRAVAAEIGVSHTTLARIEAGRLPDLKTFGLICNWLSVDPNTLLGFDNKQTYQVAAQLPLVQFRANKNLKPETAQHLGELILAIQRATSGARRTR